MSVCHCHSTKAAYNLACWHRLLLLPGAILPSTPPVCSRAVAPSSYLVLPVLSPGYELADIC